MSVGTDNGGDAARLRSQPPRQAQAHRAAGESSATGPIGLGLSMGLAVGALFGVVMSQLVFGLLVGIGIGLALGIAFSMATAAE